MNFIPAQPGWVFGPDHESTTLPSWPVVAWMVNPEWDGKETESPLLPVLGDAYGTIAFPYSYVERVYGENVDYWLTFNGRVPG